MPLSWNYSKMENLIRIFGQSFLKVFLIKNCKAELGYDIYPSANAKFIRRLGCVRN